MVTTALLPATTKRLILLITGLRVCAAYVSARFIAQRLGEAFGQSAIIDNRPGAGSNIGTDLSAKGAPEGHTLLVTHNTMTINPALPEARSQLMNQGIEPRETTIAEFAAFVRREIEKCITIVKTAAAGAAR